MTRTRFTEKQIIAVLREHEAGAKTAQLARKHGVSESTLYNWKAGFGGMDLSEAKRLNVFRRASLSLLYSASHGQAVSRALRSGWLDDLSRAHASLRDQPLALPAWHP